MNLKCVSLFSLTLLSVAASADSLTTEEYGRLTKSRYLERISHESYLNDSEGLSSVFGYNFDAFMTRDLYFGLSIYGAITGKRGGYGIAAFNLGYRRALSNFLVWDAKFLAGSGGGGGVKAGGGIAFEGLTGLSYRISKGFFADARAGYLSFPTGHFHTPVIQVGLSFDYWRVELPSE